MSAKHEAIKRQVMIDWTKYGRGTLWPNSQLTVKIKGRTIKCGLGSGTADIVGIEYYKDDTLIDPCGPWTSIEVKTHGDWLREKQLCHCETVLNNCGHYYLALESPGCTIQKPLYTLYRIYKQEDLPRVRKAWGDEWKEAVHE